MPPKPKISKDMILEAALEITRQQSFEEVNARRLAQELKCSTRPIFTCYRNMEELKKEFLIFAFNFYEKFTEEYGKIEKVPDFLLLPLSYIRFAASESQIFKLLFITDMELDMSASSDFYAQAENGEKAKIFARQIGVDEKDGKKIFFDLFLYSHGLAVLTCTKKSCISSTEAERMLNNLVSALADASREEKQ